MIEPQQDPCSVKLARSEGRLRTHSDGLVQITKSIELPLLLLNSDIELSNTFQSQFLLLDQNPDGVSHEFLGDLQDIVGHRGGEQDDLGLSGEELEDVVHVFSETFGQHLVGFVEGKDFDGVGLEESTVDH